MNRFTLLAGTLLRALSAHERVFSLLVALLIGGVAGVGAIAFRAMIFAIRSGFEQGPMGPMMSPPCAGWAFCWRRRWVGSSSDPSCGASRRKRAGMGCRR